MNVLITGSEGFIGRNLAIKISQAHNLFTIDRKKTTTSLSKKHMVGEVSDNHILSSIDVPIDVIYHFGSASSILSFKGNEYELASSEIEGFMNVMEFARRHDVKRIIYPSTASIYTKDTATGKNVVGPSNIYAAVKFAEEQIARFYSKEINTVGLRIFMVYGPGEKTKEERASPITLFIRDILEGNPPVIYGDGSQTRDPLYIDDLTEVLNNILNDSEITGIHDICTGYQISFNHVIKLIRKVIGIEISPKYVSRPKSYIEGTTGNPNLTKKLLGRNFTPIEYGIKTIYEELQNNYR